MCGICGVWNYQSDSPVEKAAVRRMTQVMAHRGPDDEGFYFDSKVGLGHRRLSIVDLEGGHQPMSNEDDTVWLICNGEIYNYLKLRRELISKGHVFKSRSDSEVIIHLYEEFGEEFMSKLNGMFAIALWDKKQQKLILARDRLGIKPLSYIVADGKLVFASEVKALLEHPLVDPELDKRSLQMYLRLFYIPSPHSIFDNIKKLQPGHYIVCKGDAIEVRQFWDLKSWEIIDGSEEDFAEMILNEFKKSVRRRLMSDVPLGVFLSGGIDSSAIVAVMSDWVGDRVKTYSVSFSESKRYDESEYANLVAKHFRTDHKVIDVNITSLDVLNDLVWHLDEPIADPSALPLYHLSRLASREVKVVLNGDGGDELFGGYRRYVWDKLATRLSSMPAPIRALANKVVDMLPKSNHALNDFIVQLRKFFFISQLGEAERYSSWFACYDENVRSLFNKDLWEDHVRDSSAIEWFENYFEIPGTTDRMNVLSYVDIKTYLPDNLMQKGDRMSMAHSVEFRFPFLDHNLVELSARVPGFLKVGGFKTKYILRKAFEELLPLEILYRKKKGFTVPVKEWFNNDLLSIAEDVLLDESSQRLGLFNRWGIINMFEQHKQGRGNYAGHLWALMIFVLWQDIFVNNKKQDEYKVVG